MGPVSLPSPPPANSCGCYFDKISNGHSSVPPVPKTRSARDHSKCSYGSARSSNDFDPRRERSVDRAARARAPISLRERKSIIAKPHRSSSLSEARFCAKIGELRESSARRAARFRIVLRSGRAIRLSRTIGRRSVRFADLRRREDSSELIDELLEEVDPAGALILESGRRPTSER